MHHIDIHSSLIPFDLLLDYVEGKLPFWEAFRLEKRLAEDPVEQRVVRGIRGLFEEGLDREAIMALVIPTSAEVDMLWKKHSWKRSQRKAIRYGIGIAAAVLIAMGVLLSLCAYHPLESTPYVEDEQASTHIYGFAIDGMKTDSVQNDITEPYQEKDIMYLPAYYSLESEVGLFINFSF